MRQFLLTLFLFTVSLSYASDSVAMKSFPQPMPWILFKTNEAVLSTSARDTLQFIGKLLKQNKPVVLEIDGYADSRGNADHNMELSVERARACADYLLAMGIDSSRILTKGYGDTKPLVAHHAVYDVSSLSPDQVFSVNRRVEFRILAFGKYPPAMITTSSIPYSDNSQVRIPIPTYISEAYDCAQRGSYDSAKTFIDYHLAKDAQGFYLKGYIYTELYKEHEKTNTLSPLRDTAAYSLLYSYNIDPSNENIRTLSPLLKFLSATYYRDVLKSIDSNDYMVMLQDYSIYKELIKTLNPQTNFAATDFMVYSKVLEMISQ